MFLYFDILSISPILNLGSLLLVALLESTYVFDFTWTGFYFDFAMICIVIFINYII